MSSTTCDSVDGLRVNDGFDGAVAFIEDRNSADFARSPRVESSKPPPEMPEIENPELVRFAPESFSG
jgi:hypothetical protein